MLAILRRIGLLVCTLSATAVFAGEIPGIPSQLPPTVERDLEISFVNDFIGRGGSVDDLRTQQLIGTFEFAERWLAVLDHSILTRNSPTLTGRLDQLSASVGYRFVDDHDDDQVNRLTIGGGFRSTGEFSGERMQNGFHQLVGSDIVDIPYTDTERTDATIWFDAEGYRRLGVQTPGNWGFGYWLHGTTLFTSDGQFDASAAAFAVADRNSINVWLGLRQDWRSGYHEDVLRQVADEEQDLAFVLGARFGALIIETVQQFDNDASYGQVRMVSSGFRGTPRYEGQPAFGIDFGFILPDVQLQFSGRFKSRFLGNERSSWRRALMFDFRYGEPQLDDDPTMFVRSYQLTLGVDMERPASIDGGWMSYFGNAGVGWRSEQLRLEGASAVPDPDAASRAVLSLGAGLRFSSANPGSTWKYRIQAGITAWIPFGDATRQLGGETIRLQEPTLGLSIGMNFDRN